MELDNKFMEIALIEAKKAFNKNEVPIGAVLVDNANHEIIAKSFNKKEKSFDVTSHAEINVLRKASKKRKSWRLNDTTLYVTLEPCSMCMSAIIQSRISRVVFILDEKEMGACGSKIDLTKAFNTNLTVFKISDNRNYKELLQSFFEKQRNNR